MIYLLIAGTYVPVCLVALPPQWGIPVLSAVGIMAALGMAIKLAGFRRVQWLGYALYPIMGWALVVAAPALPRQPDVGSARLDSRWRRFLHRRFPGVARQAAQSVAIDVWLP